MQRIIRLLVLALVLELCSHGESKTIAFNSYSSGPAEASGWQRHSARNGTNDAETATEASEPSGRAFSGGGGGGGSFPFSIHPDFLSKPVAVPRADTGYRPPKYIVYPSYSENSRNSVPYHNAPVAMDRFAPGEAYGGTIYQLNKRKRQRPAVTDGGASFASIPAASFNNPVRVASANLLRPAASDNSPVNVLPPTSGGLGDQSGPPSPPSTAGGPPSQTFFMPTPVPNSGEDTPPSSHSTETNSPTDSSEVVLFPPNSHTGYLPPANKVLSKSRPIAGYLPPSSESSSGTAVYKPSSDLYKFPPNTNSSYLPPGGQRPKNPVTSYQASPSGESNTRPNATSSESVPYNGTPELFKFPPNTNSGYLPPEGSEPAKHSATSYLPPASGDPSSASNSKPSDNIQLPSAQEAASEETGEQELHRFPPNVNSHYLPPSEHRPSIPSATSYLPPPSGDPKSPVNSESPKQGPPSGPEGSVVPDELFKFPPNIQSAYLPSKVSSKNPVTSYLPPPSGSPNSPSYHNPPIPPAQASPYRFPPNMYSQYLPPYHSHARPNNGVTSYLPPASGIPGDDAVGTIPVGPGKPQYLPPRYPDSGPPQSQPMMQPMEDPPAASMDGPPTGPSGMDDDHHHHHHHDDDHHYHHHHDHDFPYFAGFNHDHYPDVIYDHDHFHHHHDEPTTTPAPPPPPPAPDTPRLKNYSYYYLSRTLWYVPLYFTLYFTIYVAILIIRSIARHKVNLPNQWVGNGRSFASIRDLSDAETQRKATMMATFMMKQIEDFREKYL